MQDTNKSYTIQSKIEIENISSENKKKLVSVFAWLLEEDKKQNPANYQFNKLNKNK